MKKIFHRIIPAIFISAALISLSGCLSTDLFSSDGESVSLAGTFYDDSYNEYGMKFITETKCEFIHHGEPPSEIRSGTYRVKGNAVFVTLSGKWRYDLPPEMQEDYPSEDIPDTSFVLTTDDDFETLFGQPYGPRSMELELEKIDYD